MSVQSSYVELLGDLIDSNRVVFMMATARQLHDDEFFDLHGYAIAAYKIAHLRSEDEDDPRDLAVTWKQLVDCYCELLALWDPAPPHRLVTDYRVRLTRLRWLAQDRAELYSITPRARAQPRY